MMRILPWILFGASVAVLIYLAREFTFADSRNAELWTTIGNLSSQNTNLGTINSNLTATNADLKAENDALAARKDIIASFVVRVTVRCLPENGQSPDIAAHAATVASLADVQGQTITLVDDATAKLQSTSSSGQYDLAFRYRAKDESKLLGHRIKNLSSITTLGVRYAGVLGAMNLSLVEIADFTVQVNGVDVLQIENLKLPQQADSAGNGTFDLIGLGSCFSGFGEKYSAALKAGVQKCTASP
jgi:hypothetical protein